MCLVFGEIPCSCHYLNQLQDVVIIFYIDKILVFRRQNSVFFEQGAILPSGVWQDIAD